MKYSRIISLFIAGCSIAFMFSTAAAMTFFPLKGLEVGVEAGYGYLGTPDHNLLDNPNSYYDSPGLISIYQFDEKHKLGALVWGLNLGYNFKISSNGMLGFEIGYKDLGKSSYNSEIQNTDQSKYRTPVGTSGSDVYDSERSTLSGFIQRNIDQQAIDLLLTGRYFLGQNLNILGKVGVAYVRSETKQSATATTINHDYFYDSVDMTYTWSDYNLVHTDNYDHTIWRFRPEIALGVSYIFNKHLDLHVVWSHIFGFDSTVDTGEANNYYYYYYGEEYLPRYPTAYIYSSNSVVLGVSWVF